MNSRSDIGGGDVCDEFSTDGARVARVRDQLVGERSAMSLAETFRALGDPTRVRILDALTQSPLCVCEIATVIGLSESAVSHQLRLLRSLRIVSSRRQGRMVFYALDDHHIEHLFTEARRHIEEPRAARAETAAVVTEAPPDPAAAGLR